MEVAFGGFVEDSLGEGGGFLRRGGTHGPEDNVELRRRCRGEEVRRFREKLMEFERGGVAGFEALREGAAWVVGQQLLRGPESDCGGSGAGALEGDFAKVEVFGGEVGEG